MGCCHSIAVSHLSPDVVHQAVHARLHAEGVLTWQQLRVPVPVQADRTRQQLLKLLHSSLSVTTKNIKLEHLSTLSQNSTFFEEKFEKLQINSRLKRGETVVKCSLGGKYTTIKTSFVNTFLKICSYTSVNKVLLTYFLTLLIFY